MSRFVNYEENAAERSVSATYGCAIRLLSSISKRREAPLKTIYAKLWPPCRLGQILFLYNSWGAAVGYVTWAFLTEEVENFLLNDTDYQLDISEWNEGDRLWVIDIFAPYGDARSLCRKLRNLHSNQYSYFNAIRTYANHEKARFIKNSKF